MWPLFLQACGEGHGILDLYKILETTLYWTLSLQTKETDVERAAKSYPRLGPKPLTASVLSMVSGIFPETLPNSSCDFIIYILL